MNYLIESKIKLKRSQKKVWELISTPGILESVHPFCKKNKVLLWKENNEKQDLLVYLNGLEYYREFKKWDAPNGFELNIGKKDGKKSKVVWQIKKCGDILNSRLLFFHTGPAKFLKYFIFGSTIFI